MSNIRVDVDYTIKDGTEIKFRSPVDCSQITGLIVYYPGADENTVSKVFALSDAHGNNVGDIDHLFAENVVVKVILDVTSGMAFVQNADTNAYLEGKFDSKQNKYTAQAITLDASKWSNNSQTVSVSGVTANNDVDVLPAPESHVAYCEAGVYCFAQRNGSLTFTCDDKPNNNLTVNVRIWN